MVPLLYKGQLLHDAAELHDAVEGNVVGGNEFLSKTVNRLSVQYLSAVGGGKSTVSDRHFFSYVS